MLKLNLKQVLKNLAGEAIKDSDGKDVVLGKVMANAIISVGGTVDPTKNYLLATALYQQEEMELKAEDLVYLKKQIREAGNAAGTVFPVLYKGQILNILDGLELNEQEETKQDKTEKKTGEEGGA